MMQFNFHPTYAFGDPSGPRHLWFAWYPVKKFYGKWAWLERVSRQRIIKKSYLDGPDWAFWSYADIEQCTTSSPKA
jgi:hypothetical protein